MTFLNIIEGIKSISEASNTFSTWSLTILGASILAIISTSYLRPENRAIRYVYFLFIPGWISLSISMYYGNSISRRLAASFFTKNNSVIFAIGRKMNEDFVNQMNFFKAGLTLFTLWLIIYLLWWIIGNWEIKI